MPKGRPPARSVYLGDRPGPPLLVSQALLLNFDLDGVPVGEVAVYSDDTDILGAGRGADGEEEGGGEKESDEEALEVYGFHACTIGLEAGSVKFSDSEGPQGKMLAILHEDAALYKHGRRPGFTIRNSVGGNLLVALTGGFYYPDFAAVRKGKNVSGDGKEGDVVSGARGTCPENLAVFRVEAKELPRLVMGHAEEETVGHDGGTHVERDFHLAPVLGNRPLAVPELGREPVDAPVLAADEDLPVVEGGGGHVLVVGLVGEGVFPEESTGFAFDAHYGPVVPSYDLRHACDFGGEGGGVAGAVLALRP